MQQFKAFAFYMVVHLHKLYDVDNKRSLHNSISWLFVCQKLSYLIEI